MLLNQLRTYRSYHQKTITIIFHLISMPLIIFALCTIFNWLQLTINGVGSAPVTWLLIVLLTLYYCLLDWQLALIAAAWFVLFAVMTFFITGVTPTLMGFYLFLIFFGSGWLLQLLAHIFEKRMPKFDRSLWTILGAPLFLTAQIAFWLGFKKSLQLKSGYLVSKD